MRKYFSSFFHWLAKTYVKDYSGNIRYPKVINFDCLEFLVITQNKIFIYFLNFFFIFCLKNGFRFFREFPVQKNLNLYLDNFVKKREINIFLLNIILEQEQHLWRIILLFSAEQLGRSQRRTKRPLFKRDRK